MEVYDAKKSSITGLPADSFELIVALDVLEHAPDLTGTLIDLIERLKPGGQLVVSGQTENILYQIGCKFAGPEFTGDYHERGIAEIKRELATVTHIATLEWPFPLFEVFSANK